MSLETRSSTPETSGNEKETASFAETALTMGGKSVDEAKRTGAIDKADDQVESLFEERYRTSASPIHVAVWDRKIALDEFEPQPTETPADVQKVMDDSIVVVRDLHQSKTLLDEQGKIREEALQRLSAVGYWGLLVDRKYGGSGADFRSFAAFLTRMATVDPTIAGLASVHGCIGAVDPIQAFGNEDQKAKYLPKLASGERLSAFALTEPGAGSDLTALKTTARLVGDQYLVTGEKLFITNATWGRTIGLVCLIEGKPAVLIVDLPDAESDSFHFRPYGLHALKHTWNRGLIFEDFPVPKENLLLPTAGNGLTIAYHGLNRGRIALCANAAGTMRMMLASMLPWSKYRITYGASIDKRELVLRRVARIAGLITAADALTAWGSTLLDSGFRGEMECIVAKIFGSEAQKEAAIELFMKTHGGRSFLHGHMFGDHVHEYLAPCIYEGEGEMLAMAFFKSLVKSHGVKYFEPVGKALQAAGIKQPNMANPAHLWALKNAMGPYAGWMASRYLSPNSSPDLSRLPEPLREHAAFACDALQDSSVEISGAMRKHQLKLADRQLRMAELSSRVQKMTIILCTALYAAKQSDETVRLAAAQICGDLRRELTGRRPSDREYRAAHDLGARIVSSGFPGLSDIVPADILMRYDEAN
jgi:alkylation response protein AidB-like acyl-CoA dehydrogenase